MASRRQVSAAKRNIKKAQRTARKQRTIAKLPKSVRSDLGRQAAKAGSRSHVWAGETRIAVPSRLASMFGEAKKPWAWGIAPRYG